MVRAFVVGLLFTSAAAFGQPTEQRYSGDGFVFFSADRPSQGSLSDLLGVGVGGEGFIYKGLGVQGDLGYEFPRGYVADGIGLASLNGTYHFVNRNAPRKLVPFVVAGYAIAFRGGVAGLFDYGGGVNFWFHRHLGLRVEVRAFQSTDFDTLFGFRFGLSFR